MILRTCSVVVLCILLIGGLTAAADQSAKVSLLSGNATVMAGGAGAPKALKKDDFLRQGDVVEVAPGGKLTLTFGDGASMDVAGPASFSLKLLADFARTVELRTGSINRLMVKSVTTGVTTPLDAFVAVQEGVVSVKLDAVGGKQRATFKLWEGASAKVFDGSRTRILGVDRPIVVERAAGVSAPAEEAQAPVVRGEAVILIFGVHEVEINPKGYFNIQPTAGGGAIITSIAPVGEFGMVTIDKETTFYLAKDEAIEIDGYGKVVRHTGIVHVYAALDVRGIYDEAVADPSDSSPTGKKSPGGN